MARKVKNVLQMVPGYGILAIAMKEINLIKTQKIALALILLYPVIVIGTLGAAFSGNTTISSIDVAFYAPEHIEGFDTQAFVAKLKETNNVNLLVQQKEEDVEKVIRQRKAKLGIIVEEPEPTSNRYRLSLLTDNSNFASSEFFFQIANNSVRRVGFDTSRELLIEIWNNLSKIKSDLSGEIAKVDSFAQQLEGTEKELLDLNKSVSEIDIVEMRKKLKSQDDILKELEPKIASFGDKISTFGSVSDQKINKINETKDKIRGFKGDIISTKRDIKTVREQLDQYRSVISQNQYLLAAFNKILETESKLANAETQLTQTEAELDRAKNDLVTVKTELSAASKEISDIKGKFATAHGDLNYFNNELSSLGRTVDKVSNLVASSLETKKKVKADLEASKAMMESFVTKLDELHGLSPEFLANPIIINKKPIYDAKNLEIITPIALALLLLLTTILLTGVSFVVERNEGAYSRLLLSTTGKIKLFAGKILGQLIFALIEASIILGVAIVVFGIKIAGTQITPATMGIIFTQAYLLALVQIYAAFAVISVAFISIGLFISNYTKIQSTTILAGLLLVIPMMFLSGIIIPSELMSPQIQEISATTPLSLGILIITELIIKGTFIADLLPEMVKLLVPAFIFIVFTLANKNL